MKEGIEEKIEDTYKILEVNTMKKPFTCRFVEDTCRTDHYAAGRILTKKYPDVITDESRKIYKSYSILKNEVAYPEGFGLKNFILPYGDSISFISKTDCGIVLLSTLSEFLLSQEKFYLMCFNENDDFVYYEVVPENN